MSRGDYDPRNLLDDPDDYRPEYKTKGRPQAKPSTRNWGKVSETPRGPKQPLGVSDNVWAHSQKWFELGEATLDRRIPLSIVNFAERLGKRINHDNEMIGWIDNPGYGITDGRYFVTDIIDRMIGLFWEGIHGEEGNRYHPGLANLFIDDYWDYYVNRAHNWAVADSLKAGLDTGQTRVIQQGNLFDLERKPPESAAVTSEDPDREYFDAMDQWYESPEGQEALAQWQVEFDNQEKERQTDRQQFLDSIKNRKREQ